MPPSFGGLRVLHQLGSGVLGPVFRAHDTEHDRLVAIKTFTLDLIPEDAARLAESLGRLVQDGPDHPALAGFVQAGLEGATPYLATAFADGETLDVWLRGRGPLGADGALAILDPVAEALDAAWDAGVGHLALHPRDIFVSADGDAVTLTGVGVARTLASVGVPRTPRRPYAAPEYAAGAEGDARADVYSLAAIAHELLTGRRPTSTAVAHGAFAESVPAAAQARLVEAMEAGLAASPDRRPASAGAFVLGLRTALDQGQPELPWQAPGNELEEFADELHDTFVAVPTSAAPASSDDGSDLMRSAPRPDPSFGDTLPAPPPEPASRGWMRLAGIAIVGLAIGVAGVAMFLRDQGADTTEVVVLEPAAAETNEAPASSDTEVDLDDNPPVMAEAAPPVDPAPAPVTAAPVPPPAPPAARRVAAPMGQLLVRSEPSGALVFVDGQMRGETPATLRDLALGAHDVQVARPGYAPESRAVTLTPDVPSRNLSVTLQPGLDTTAPTTGSVFADSRPRGARVFVNGRLVGTTPLRLPDLAAGPRAVRIELDGYRPVTTTVTVTGGREARVAVTLERTSGPAGRR